MNLGQLLHRVRELPNDECVFARKPWSTISEAIALPLSDDFQPSEHVSQLGMDYFLEVAVAKEVLEVLGDRPASKEEESMLLIFYAENDAYPDWVYKR